MESTNFDTGLVSIAINGDENRVIKFNATDTNLVVRLTEVQERFEKLEEKYKDTQLPTDDTKEIVKLIVEMENEVKENLNYLFNADVYDTIFNGTSPFTLVNGKMLVERVLEAFTPILEKYIGEENKKVSKRIAKYQKAYK